MVVVSEQNMLVTLFAWGITFIVPAIVWLTLVAGLLQLVFSGIRRSGIVLPGTQRFAHKPARQM